MIIPVTSFISLTQAIVNIVCLLVGIVAALLLDKFNSSVSKA